MFTSELTLKPISPFSFDLSAQIFGNGDQQIRFYENGKFSQIIRIGHKLSLATLESTGTVEQPSLRAKLEACQKISDADKNEAKKILTRLFNLDLDLSKFYVQIKKDKTLRQITQALRGLRSPTTQTVYESLIDSIIEQQISLKVATSMERRIIKKYGEALTLDGATYYAYPTPSTMAKATIEDLRNYGLSQRKGEYVKEISTLVSERKLDLEKFRTYENAKDIVEELDAVRGIGVWTAELTVIRSMQKWDAMPADDVGLRRIISRYYCEGKKITSEEAKKIAEPWGKWRGLAAYYFVVAELVGLEA